ncbi:MAG: hypothetical protein M1837_001487 [Sclerophora amabilis]|nr:MAG: hypothetical protein M1837_001487 [Sclerophora amabilis]
MASHQVAIAKASFSAALLRPDPSSVPREDIAHFHKLLERAITECSPTNVQNCKRWLLESTVASPARITALGKYLGALSSSFAVPAPGSGALKPSPRRKRVHILYLVNDLLHHTKYRIDGTSVYSTFATTIQPLLRELFTTAASFKGCPKHQAKIRQLLSIWEDQQYYSRGDIEKLQEAVNEAEHADVTTPAQEAPEDVKADGQKSVPFVMPTTHGDPSAPYYDLPAGNMMPHIIPNSLYPINPQSMKPLQFIPGPAEEGLVMAVTDFLKEVDRMYGSEKHEDEGIVVDIDELGQPLIRDEVTGESLGGESYYGWSKSFCAKMRAEVADDRGHTAGLGQGQGLRKEGSDRASTTATRNRSTDHRTRPILDHEHKNVTETAAFRAPDHGLVQGPGASKHQINAPPPPPPPPPPYAIGTPNQGHFVLPQGFQIPPPPPFHSGPWPPPPPPPPPFVPTNVNFNQSGGQFPLYPGFPPPPPPPPNEVGQVQWSGSTQHDGWGNGGYHTQGMDQSPSQTRGQGYGVPRGRGDHHSRGARSGW